MTARKFKTFKVCNSGESHMIVLLRGGGIWHVYNRNLEA